MSFESPSHQMASAWTQLQQQWTETRNEWNDSRQAQFEREFWNEWERIMPAALSAFREFETLLENVEQNVE